jgi:hypothetical protein
MSCDGGHLGYKIYKVLDYPIINNVQFGFHQHNSLDCFWENVFFVFFPLGPMLKICHAISDSWLTPKKQKTKTFCKGPSI